MRGKLLRKFFLSVLMCVVLTCAATSAFATHVFGIDLYYTHVSGNTYRIYVIIFGDCAGNAFPSLQNASPQVKVYEDPSTNTVATLSLVEEPPIPGVEVTPVCPADINNTTCTNINNPIPGIKKFVYWIDYTVPYPSANWRFHFTGSTVTSSAGRSTTITNIVNPGSTIIALDAKLNNLNAPNNSSIFGTIPTPFYCLNIPANYAPGSVDADNDSLYFVQVPGKDANGFPAVPPNVTYIAPYTATAPLAANPFIFVPTTGQMSFTPNLVQRSLAVMEVREYRNQVMVGTSQREMTVVVLNTCNNWPPSGIITNPSAGVLLDSTTLRVCQDVGPFTFDIDPHDPNNDTFDVTPVGIPAGATFTITNNHTPSPHCVFSWNTMNVAPGTYTFYLDYTDNECPLSADQQIAYQVIIAPVPGNLVTLISPATCTKKAVFTVYPGPGVSNWTETVLQGANVIHTNNNLNGTLTDSLVAGTYTIRVTNDVSCSKDTVITLLPPVVPAISATMTPPTCPGATDGSITINGTGGAPPYTYAMGAGPYTVTNTFTNLGAGTYTMHLKDTSACIIDTVLTLPDGLPILLDVSVKRPTCSGNANGIVTIVAYNNPATPYTYAMNAGPFGPNGTFTGLAAGTYTFHVHNATGCNKDTILTLIDSLTITASTVVTNLLCNGDSSGSIVITGTGGASPYTYALNLNPYVLNNTFTNLAAGTYTMHVLDAGGCAYQTIVSITQPTPLTASATPVPPLCNGGTGSITITASGGTPGYTYANGAGPYNANNVFTGLAAGTYTLHARDLNSCTKDVVVTLTQPTPVTVSPTLNNVLCFGNTTGSISINASGGTPGYTYANGAGPYGPANTFSPLAAGTYTIHTKDANGCIKDTVLTITQPTPLTVSAAVTNPLCYGEASGSITITAAGGTPGYNYANGAAPYGPMNTFTNLMAGTYTIHTRDANNCIKDTVVTLTQPPMLSLAAGVKNSTCATLGDGKVTLTATGGTPTYTYANGAGPYTPNNTFTPLPAGTYLFHVKDAHGCVKDLSVIIIDSIHPSGIINVTDELCYGQSTGTIKVSGTNATAPYTYAIGNNPYTNADTFTQLPAGTYVIHIKDANGCIKDTTATIAQPTALSSSFTYTEPSCFGYSDGSVTVTAYGGTPAYTYAINNLPFSINSLFTGLPVGTDTIHIQDNNGCLYDTLVSITQPTKLVIDSIVLTPEKCYGDANATLSVFASGGTPAYEYATGSGNFQPSNLFGNLPVGNYAIHIRDSHSCPLDTSATILQPPPLSFNGINIKKSTCEGYADGSVDLAAAGGIPPYLYSSDGNTYAANTSFTGLPEGMYTFYVKDSNDCKHDTTLGINGYPHIAFTDATVTPALCYGSNDGIISINVTDGTPPFYYQVDGEPNPPSASNVFTGIHTGYHTITIIDSNDCRKSGRVQVGQPDSIKISLAATPNECVGNEDRGMISAEVTGGTAPYIYAWSNDTSGPGMNSITNLANGAYRLTVYDAHSCKQTADTQINATECCMPYIPNAFTPNGDGKNDVFRIAFKGNIKLVYFSVYNRFGERVFTTAIPNFGWDGIYKGQTADVGTYFFETKFICGQDGKEQFVKGDVTLIR